MFGTAWIYRCRYEGKIVRMLDVSGSLQSATYLDNDNWCDLAFPYMRLYDHVKPFVKLQLKYSISQSK